MNLAQEFGGPKTRWLGVTLVASALFIGPIAPPTLAQERKGNPLAAAVSPKVVKDAERPASTVPTKDAQNEERPREANSTGIQDILKMADAGVSSEVIRTYIEHSSANFAATPADLITLKEHGVADDALILLLNRSASLKPITRLNQKGVAAPAIVRRLSTGGELDPESYEFWYYHYAYPRALSYSHRTLSRYDPALHFGRPRFQSIRRY